MFILLSIKFLKSCITRMLQRDGYELVEVVHGDPDLSETPIIMATAAASFMFSVMSVASASSAPRKMPGNASTLLIWFG